MVASEDEDSGTDRKTDNAVMEPHCVGDSHSVLFVEGVLVRPIASIALEFIIYFVLMFANISNSVQHPY